MSTKFEQSKSEGAHHLFTCMVGNWEGVAKTWFNPDELSDESTVKGTMRLILGGRFLLHEYQGSMNGKPLEGVVIYGNQLSLGKFQSIWVDSFHTGTDMMFSEGKRNDASLNVTGIYVYVTPEKEHTWGWRTEISLINENELLITAYNISPESEESKATELLYMRV
jgi:hypothetical protein